MNTPSRFSENRCRSARLQARRPNLRALKKPILIICEGKETEPNYFNLLKREDIVTNRFTIKVKRGSGGTRLQIVHSAVKLKVESDIDDQEVWCVFDTEELRSEESRKDLSAAISLASANSIITFISNPSFEVWLLAHFVRTSKSFRSCDDVIVELNKQWKKTLQLTLSKE